MNDPQAAVEALLRARRGHFLLESNHHGELWLDLESLCTQPAEVRSLAETLAGRLAEKRVEVVCGPLIEGAFVALFVAETMSLPFSYTEREPQPAAAGLFPYRYRLPPGLREQLAGRRVAIVNDVINAGSAVRATQAELVALRAEPVAVGTLLTLGNAAAAWCSAEGLELVTLAELPNQIWAPEACPLCRDGVALET